MSAATDPWESASLRLGDWPGAIPADDVSLQACHVPRGRLHGSGTTGTCSCPAERQNINTMAINTMFSLSWNGRCTCRGHRRCRGTGLDGSCVRGHLVSEQRSPLFPKCMVLWELLPRSLGKGKQQGGKLLLSEGSRFWQHKAICGERLTKTCLLSTKILCSEKCLFAW